jgi:regulatory protein
MQRRLVQAGYEPEEVEGELGRLEAVGLIDDADFARQLARHEFGIRGSGARVVVGALAAKGVAPALIDAVVAELGGDPEDRAEALARARALRLGALEPAKAFTRLSGFLVRRGYDPALARAVARRVLVSASGDD